MEDKYMFKKNKEEKLNKDQIINDVFEVQEEKEESKMIKFLRAHRKGVIFTVIGTVLAAGAGIAYSMLGNSDQDEADDEISEISDEENDETAEVETVEF